MPGKLPEVPIWFPDTRLNYAENVLQHQHDGIAINESTEAGPVANISFRELRERVRITAAALRANGLKIGDRVAGEIPSLTLIMPEVSSDFSGYNKFCECNCDIHGRNQPWRYLFEHCYRYGH